jgi:hypothetical protein
VNGEFDEAIHSDQVFHNGFTLVMPGLVPGIHVFFRVKTWMAGTSPAMTRWWFRATREIT